MKKLYGITVRGKRSTWGFNFWGDECSLEDWRNDGLEIHQICNTVPSWAASLGLTRTWFWLQDHYIIPLE